MFERVGCGIAGVLVATLVEVQAIESSMIARLATHGRCWTAPRPA